MRPFNAPPPRPRPPLVLTTTVRAFLPTWRTTVLTLSELGAAAFFVSGITQARYGAAGPWFVLVAVMLGFVVRVVEVENWALFIPGGLAGRVNDAFGPRLSMMAAAAALLERLLFVALVGIVAGRYVVTALASLFGAELFERHTGVGDVTSLAAVLLVGVLWLRTRLGQPWSVHALGRWTWLPVAVLVGVSLWGLSSYAARFTGLPSVAPPLPDMTGIAGAILAGLAGVGIALPAVGGGGALTRRASELPQPRLRSLQNLLTLSGIFSVLVIGATSFAFGGLVPQTAQGEWWNTPLLGVITYSAGPAWIRGIAMFVLSGAGVVILAYAAQAGLGDAEAILARLSQQGLLSGGLRLPHPRFGTLARLADAAALAVVVTVLASSGRVPWLSSAYAVLVAVVLLFSLSGLVRLRIRRARPEPGGIRPPVDPENALPSWGLISVATLVGLTGLAMLTAGDAGALTGAASFVVLATVLALTARKLKTGPTDEELETVHLLPSIHVSLEPVHVRPGNILVAVRHPHSLGHLAAALQQVGDRDVVVMTARLLGLDVPDDGTAVSPTPTPEERFLFSQVTALAEQFGQMVHLSVVPAHNAFDAVIAAVVRERSSEVHVGESVTLSADEQARQLGEAWERAAKTAALHVRLVVHHRSGGTQSYFLGAHAPTLSESDLDLIHHLWLDAAKSVGSHVHHHDIVRAALNQMSQQLNSPNRQDALGAIREVARPAEEIAAVVRSRDFASLRDMMRNRPPQDVADMLSTLAIEDQVVAFRVLPRKDAAAVFEYLSQDAQESLLKAMAQEDIAGLLNEMAPDDRTMFLEELPAAATRQLLSLLTPEEQKVARTLLGYPEGSIGRLMTPQYIAVHENWTVQQVLDHVREHGEDSETLNVIYVVDNQGALIDDIRIRELLLAKPTMRVSDLMDRRFVALKATDDQEAAITVFRQNDRVALPVTDTAGMLIGIVTIDDVLHVAEAAATKEIQRIGGSEALDEPYMDIAFTKMIRKRAGWLTALFLGEMLTATAMGFFENTLSRALVLTMFIPLIISSGGNSGSQASTLVIRALALGEVGLRDWWRIMRREIFAGLALGSILGAIGFLRITIWSQFSDLYTAYWPLVALTVAVALIGVVLWGTLTGSLLPLLLRRLGFDPATSSAPFVATLVDVTGLVIYFSVATVILHSTLLK